jgi:hypothetical protein
MHANMHLKVPKYAFKTSKYALKTQKYEHIQTKKTCSKHQKKIMWGIF